MESWLVPLFIVVILVLVVVQLVRSSLKTRRTMAQAQELLAEAPTTRGVVVDTYTRRSGPRVRDNILYGGKVHNSRRADD